MHNIGISQNTYVPDDNFEQALIDLGLDSGPLNDVVPTMNISVITNLDINNLNITDLTGIEDFAALTILDCSNNNITTIDVTNNSALMILWCSNNLLTSIDVTQNIHLISLVCSDNLITNLDLLFNPNLNVLVCENNQLTTIDVTENITLNRFQCGYNMLSNIDVSRNSNLSTFTCENNQLATLDLSYNSNLSFLDCRFNQLSELDVSENSSLTAIDCSNNNLCRLNLKNGNNINLDAYFISNFNLNCVVVDNPSDGHGTWIPANFPNYVSSQNACGNFVNVDSLNNVITNSSYTLPAIIYGNYYTESGANGTALFSGDRIVTSQTIYIYNESLCASNESSFYVLITNEDYYIPKFFTPNNDGSHDYWQVFDNSNVINTINIYNRYGKLLKSLPPNSEGWNGTFNGQPLESNDYWYTITLNSGQIIKGHFTLKR